MVKDFSWIRVKKYNMNESLSWEERYKELENHHNKETSFLIKTIEELKQHCNCSYCTDKWSEE